MKTYSLFIAIFAFLMVVSCQNETPQPSAEQANETVENAVEDYSPAVDSTVAANEFSKNDSMEITEDYTSEKVSNRPEKAKIKIEKKQTKAKLDKKQEKKAESKEEVIKTAEDLSGELDNEVNRQANPDNYNGVAEVDSKSNVNLVPVYTEQDLDKYYVQVAVKVRKMSKSELAQVFPSTEPIYVVQNEGLFKYCLGKFDTEAEAIAYKKEVDKKFNFKDTQAVTYKQAW